MGQRPREPVLVAAEARFAGGISARGLGGNGDGRECAARRCSVIALERLGTVDDIAAAVVYLASEEASYVTGQVLNVSGGLYI